MQPFTYFEASIVYAQIMDALKLVDGRCIIIVYVKDLNIVEIF